MSSSPQFNGRGRRGQHCALCELQAGIAGLISPGPTTAGARLTDDSNSVSEVAILRYGPRAALDRVPFIALAICSEPTTLCVSCRSMPCEPDPGDATLRRSQNVAAMVERDRLARGGLAADSLAYSVRFVPR